MTNQRHAWLQFLRETLPFNQYADKLLAEMSLTEKVHQMSGDTGWWELAKLVVLGRLK